MISLTEIISIAKIFFIFFTISYSLFFPLLIFFTINVTSKICLVLSITFEIVFGYTFYSFRIINSFIPYYFICIVFLNLLAIIILLKKNTKFRIKFNLSTTIVTFIVLLPLLFTRFFDTGTSILPGVTDIYHHIQFFKELALMSHLTQAYYAPGFHILFYPIVNIVGIENTYRFSGPIIGILIIINTVTLFYTYLSRKSLIVLTLLSCVPVFNRFIISSISFWPTTLTYFFFTFYIYLLQKPREINTKQIYLLNFFGTLGLSLTVPYFFVNLVPSFIILLIISLIPHRDVAYSKFILVVSLISVTGVMIGYFHVFLQTSLSLSRHDYLPAAFIAGNDPVNKQISKITNSETVKNFPLPFYGIVLDLFTPKFIRSPFQKSSINTYLITFISLICLILLKFWNKYSSHQTFPFTIFTLTTFFGIVQIFGILEITNYRGRAGFYLLFLALFIPTLIIDKLLNKYKAVFPILAVLLFAISFTRPPSFERSGICQEAFYKVYEIRKTLSPNQTLKILSNDMSIGALVDQVITEKIDLPNIDKQLSRSNLVILNKTPCFDENTSKFATTDINIKMFVDNITNSNKAMTQINKSVSNSKEFDKYTLFYQSSDIDIYKNKFN